MTNNLIALYSLTRKEIHRVFRIWKQTLLPPVITSVLYFLIFGKFIGERVGEIDGISYMAFIVPGFILMSVINNSYANVSSSFFGAKFQNSIEELLVSPMPNWMIIMAYSFGGIVRGIISGVLIYAVALFFVDISIYSYAYSFAFIILTSMLFSLAGLFNAFFAKSFDDVSLIPTFVITPLVYLGGVFFSIKFVEGSIWATIAQFNPITYMINGFRYGILGYSEQNIIYSAIALVITIIILFIINLALMKRGYGLKS